MSSPNVMRRNTTSPCIDLQAGQAEDVTARGQVYERLSFLFGAPDQGFLEKDTLDAFNNNVLELGLVLDQELLDLDKFLSELSDTTALAREYVRLFRGPVRAAVYPYESMHVDGEVMGTSTLAVLNSYRGSGLALSQGFRDLPDHVCAEFEFMYYLCARELHCWQRQDPEGLAESRRLQRSFLVEHLAAWIPSFVEGIEKNTSSPFYRALASITRKFLYQESTRLVT